jgi:four helix bundle protein
VAEAMKFEELRVLKMAEAIADGIWRAVARWDLFARDVVGGQLAKAADSIGANIAEAFGRYHFGEKLQFLYYARGSLFETKYWLNRALQRNLMPVALVQENAAQLTDVARQLNSFAATIKTQRHGTRPRSNTAREPSVEYLADSPDDISSPLFADDELAWLSTIPNT